MTGRTVMRTKRWMIGYSENKSEKEGEDKMDEIGYTQEQMDEVGGILKQIMERYTLFLGRYNLTPNYLQLGYDYARILMDSHAAVAKATSDDGYITCFGMAVTIDAVNHQRIAVGYVEEY